MSFQIGQHFPITSLFLHRRLHYSSNTRNPTSATTGIPSDTTRQRRNPPPCFSSNTAIARRAVPDYLSRTPTVEFIRISGLLFFTGVFFLCFLILLRAVLSDINLLFLDINKGIYLLSTRASKIGCWTYVSQSNYLCMNLMSFPLILRQTCSRNKRLLSLNLTHY